MAGSGKGVVGVIAAVAATAVAKKAVDATWRMGAKKSPPTDPTDPDVSAREAVLFAVLSGAVVAVAKMIVSRKAAQGQRNDKALLAQAKADQA